MRRLARTWACILLFPTHTHTKRVFVTLPASCFLIIDPCPEFPRISPNFGFLGNGPSRFISAVNSRSCLPRTSHNRLFQDFHDSSGSEWRSGVASAHVEVTPRPLLWGASRDSSRDQDELSIIAG